MKIRSKLVMSERGNLIHIIYAETWQPDTIQTPKSQMHVHNQDPTLKS